MFIILKLSSIVVKSPDSLNFQLYHSLAGPRVVYLAVYAFISSVAKPE